MKYLSLFSGIEAATAAWAQLGWGCVGVSDIDPFACNYLAQRHPGVPNLGDITLITEADIAALGAIDLVVFGSPCQDLSVAGKRKGLDGERSGLFFAAMRIVEWARKHGGCRFALWENVPGAFSGNGGADFGAVVGQMAGVEQLETPPKGWGTEGAIVGTQGMVEWSVLDAQWFGVAQRRRRVFALADFGDWAGRPPILLEPESLRGDFAPSREAGQSATRGFEVDPSGSRFTDVTPTIDCRAKNGPMQNQIGAGVLAVSVALHGREGGGTVELGGPVSETLHASGGGDKQHVLVGVQRPVLTPAGVQTVWPLQNATRGKHQNGIGISDCNDPIYTLDQSSQHAVACVTGQVTHTLKAEGFDASEDGTGRGTPIVPWATGVTIHGTDGCKSIASFSETAQCLRARTPGNIDNSSTTVVLQALPVAYSTKLHNTSSNQAGKIYQEYTTALDRSSPPPALLTGMQVRRLTPAECERLQGFPDGHTAITVRSKPAADGPRYKALGNSMAVPVMAWIGKQIDHVVMFY